MTRPRTPQRELRARPYLTTLEDRVVPSLDFGWALGAGSTAAEIGRAVARDSAGDVYITGEFEGIVDFDPGPGTYNLVHGGGFTDAFVAKYTAAGSLAWAVSMANWKIGNGIAVDGAGNVYATGQGDESRQGFGDGAFLVNLNAADGALIWTREVGNLWGYSVDVDGGGNVYVVGQFSNSAQFGSTTLTTSYGEQQGFVTKLDAAGNFHWAVATATIVNGSGLNSGAQLRKIAVDSAGNAYITGQYDGTVDFDPGSANFNLTSLNGSADIIVWKLDTAGDFVWAKSMGSTGGDGFGAGASIALDGAGNLLVAGSWDGTNPNDFDPGPGTLRLTRGQVGFVVKLNASGSLVWGRSLPEAAWSVAVDSSANVYTTGRFSGSLDFDPGKAKVTLTSAGNTDSFVSKLTSAGNFAAAVRMGGNSFDAGYSITVDGSNNVYTTGLFNGTGDFDPGSGTFNLTSAGSNDVFVSKLTQSGTLQAVRSSGAALMPAPRDSSTPKSLAPIGLDGSFAIFDRFIFDPTLDRPNELDLLNG